MDNLLGINTLEKATAYKSIAQASEITVVVKDDEKSLRAKYLIYESYNIAHDDEVIMRCVAKTIESFQGEPESVRIRISMEL